MKDFLIQLVVLILLAQNLEGLDQQASKNPDYQKVNRRDYVSQILPDYKTNSQSQVQSEQLDQVQQQIEQKQDKKVVLSKEEKLLSEEWEVKMSDFEPQDLITVAIAASTEEIFGQNIRKVPSTVRGAWFVSNSDSEAINIEIVNQDTVIFKQIEKKEGIFKFEATKQGLYEFKLYNANLIDDVHVTFAFHAGNSSDELLEQKHLTPIEERLLEVDKIMKDLWVDIEFSEIRHESHFKTIADANKNIFLFTFLECVVILSLSSWQAFYIKRLLDNRVII